MKQKVNSTPEYDVYIMDIRYTDTAYNPESVKEKKRDIRYIVGADGKEYFCVKEEK